MDNQVQVTEKQKKQKRLSVGLRIVSGLLAVVAVFAFSGMNCLKRAIPYLTSDEVWKLFGGTTQQQPIPYERYVELMKGHFVFSFVAMLLVYCILWAFQRVCIEIGKDNSFSVENVKNFYRMAWTAVAAAILYLIKMIVFVSRFVGAGYVRVAEVLAWGYTIALFGFLLFAYLCRSLAKLIFNAYEVQTENDLTI